MSIGISLTSAHVVSERRAQVRAALRND